MKTKRIVSITLACVLLATAVITGIALFVTNNKPVVADKDNVLDSNLVASIDAPGKVKLIQTPLRAASSNVDSFVLTATVDSTDSDLNAIEWSTEFANPSSAWATGKKVSDYVTITVDGSDPNKVTVKNTAPFGEVINVVAKAKYFDVSAKCKLDYIKRIQSVSVSFKNKTHNNEAYAIYLNSKNELDWVITPTFGVGTVQGEIAYHSSNLVWDAEYLANMIGISGIIDEDLIWEEDFDLKNNVFSLDSLFLTSVSTSNRKKGVNKIYDYLFVTGNNNGDFASMDEQDTEEIFDIHVGYNYRYNGKDLVLSGWESTMMDDSGFAHFASLRESGVQKYFVLYRNGVTKYSEVGNITLSESGYAF